MIGEVLLGLTLILVIAPETRAARSIRRHLVEMPARWLSRLHRGQVALGAILALGVGLIVAFLDLEALRIASMAAPDLAATLIALDAATLCEVALATVAAWSMGGMRRLTSHLPRIKPRGGIRNGARRKRSAAARRVRPANDDDSDPAPDRARFRAA